MAKNKIIGITIGIFALLLIILYVLKSTLLASMRLNYIGAIISLVLIMNATLVLILNPKEQNKLLAPRPIGYGSTINPRNLVGLLIYAFLILLSFLITA
ncbi:hypothetical protein [Enterococcus sp. AZ007]|uniref:hypothetical protein n=1 Tax=Enterococcus sp. AZ007 TaxID=2774839 RepID=UPI003F249095